MRSLLALVALISTVLAVTPARADVIAGRVLLKLEKAPATDAEAGELLDALAHGKDVGLALERRSAYGWVVARVDATDTKRTEEALTLLRGDAGVVAADVIRMQRALRLPNDELVGDLWGFTLIDVETAWDTTIGLSSQRIGVVDSGINRDHFDLFARDVRGFDFISDPSLAEDGDGRDAEYQDEAPSGGFHGSHVSGTISAEADDFFGVPGLNWNAGLVTARALADVGSTLDIVEAAAWLAGADIPGVPSIGADRVSVINLSLGSVGPCSAFEEDLYGQIIASGVTVVAAAGNEGNDVGTAAPANCPGVIAVGAVGRSGVLASYSNFDDRIDVVAPGGDGFNNDPFESILSVDGSTVDGYVAFDGTSMAAPHVTGIVSLMQAVNPRLSPRQIQSILVSSPFTCAQASCDNKAFLDAADAIAKAQTTTGELGDGAGDGVGGGACPPNSQLTSDGEACVCNAGFEVNASETGCEPTGDSDDGANDDDLDDDGCGPNSEINDDGTLCICDPGFVVNEAQTACVAEDSEDGDDEDEDDDSDEDSDEDSDDFRGSSFSGCTSTSTVPSSLCALAALLLLTRRGRNGRASRAALGSATIVVACFVSTGCAHTVRIESTPGAEIFVNGKSVGTAPAMYSETTGSSDTVQVTAKLHGREKTVMVKRGEVDMLPIGAGAGIGVGACMAGGLVSGLASLVFVPCAFVGGPVSWAACAAAPVAGWWFFSHKMPDVVRVDLGEPPRVNSLEAPPPSEVATMSD